MSELSRFRLTERKSEITVRTRMIGSGVVKWEVYQLKMTVKEKDLQDIFRSPQATNNTVMKKRRQETQRFCIE